MIEIDGSQKSGSGTILRLSVALSAILKEPLHIYKIRQKRPQPGLKPQHLEAVLTAAKLCDGELKGAKLGSRELWLTPHEVKGGTAEAGICTAGSIPMLLLTVLPICAFAKNPVRLHVAGGGTDVTHSPTINYMRFVLLPMLQRIGLNANLAVKRYGYYPKGMGEVTMTVEPCRSFTPIHLENFGNVETIRGISVCTFLAERKVAERQAETAREYLRKESYGANIETIDDMSNPLQKGSSLVLWAETDSGVILGADAIGELRKTSETVGKEASDKLLAELSAKPTVDVYLADMLVPYLALAQGESLFLTRTISEHLDANIWLVERILKARFRIEKAAGLYKIEKVT